MSYELTKKRFYEAAGIEVELCEDGEWRPKKGFLLDKPVKRKTKKSSTLKSLDRKSKKNSLREFFDVAGVSDESLAQKLIENEGN
jgi:hypothetical protein